MRLGLNIPVRFPPREQRQAANAAACLLLPDGRELQVVIKNITPHGFMAASRIPIDAPCEFGVEISEFGIVRAKIRWIDGRDFGAAFLNRLPLTAVSRVLTGKR